MNASTSPLPASDQTLRGILLICAAVFLFASHDGLSKFLSGFYPIVMVVWARYLVHTLLMVAVFVPRNGLAVIRTRRPLMQLARALCLIGTSLFFTTGLRYLPLAEATAVNFLAPLLVTALSVPLLKEKVSLGQWLAVLTGFIGVLFIVRPGGALFTPAALFPLGSALCFGLYQLLTRMLANSDSPTTSNFLAGIFNTLIMSLLVPFFWQTPSLLHGLMMIALGGCGMGRPPAADPGLPPCAAGDPGAVQLWPDHLRRPARPAGVRPRAGRLVAARHPRHLRQRPGGRLAPWPLNATGSARRLHNRLSG